MTDDLVQRLRDLNWICTHGDLRQEAADRIETLEHVLSLGVHMRQKQIAYFKSRDHSDLGH